MQPVIYSACMCVCVSISDTLNEKYFNVNISHCFIFVLFHLITVKSLKAADDYDHDKVLT